jgi:hypothetical protein
MARLVLAIFAIFRLGREVWNDGMKLTDEFVASVTTENLI